MSSRPEAAWAAEIHGLLDDGQYFLAYDVAKEANKVHPDNLTFRLLGALALVRSGAAAEARRLLDPVADRLAGRSDAVRDAVSLLRRIQPLLAANDHEADSMIGDLARAIVRLGSGRAEAEMDDSDTPLMGDIFLEMWKQGGRQDDLVRSLDSFERSFRGRRGRQAGLNAAVLSWLAGDAERARLLAEDVVLLCRPTEAAEAADRARFDRAATEGEALLILGDAERAVAAYRRAAGITNRPYAWVVQALQRLRLLQSGGVAVPDELFRLLKPPTVLVFAGQPLDAPGGAEGFFPPHIEGAVRAAIAQGIDQLGAEIGYCSASCGSDILFIESMIERGAEVHVWLPFALEDFVRARVAYGGPRWERRFRNALKLASTVSFATEEPYLGHDVLFRFNNQLIEGMARLRADFLCTEPLLMLVWDYLAPAEAGTAADFMDHWPDMTRLKLIDLDDLRSAAADAPVAPVVAVPPLLPRREPAREIKTLMFSDMVGFSKLNDGDLPALWRFLDETRRFTEGCAPDLLESWGDALYVSFSRARDILRFAFGIQRAFRELDPFAYGLPRPIQLRTALHAGPVYDGKHPLTGRGMFYGSHVSRAARLEPVTVSGEIYATHQFVALLTTEERAELHAAQMTGAPYRPWYVCEYLGVMSLAKGYGTQPVYHLRAV